MNKLRILLVTLILSLLLFSAMAGGKDPQAECVTYCQTYWADAPAQYQQCIQDCRR